MTEVAHPPPPPPPEAKPPESGGVYLALSILSTILCCLPFGIPAIVFASRIDGQLRSGDIAGATQSAKQAKIWIIVSAASGFAVLAIYLIFILAAGAGVLNEALKK